MAGSGQMWPRYEGDDMGCRGEEGKCSDWSEVGGDCGYVASVCMSRPEMVDVGMAGQVWWEMDIAECLIVLMSILCRLKCTM